MGVGDGEQLEQTLDTAVLAPAAVQGIEADVRPDLGKALGKIAADVDRRYPVAGGFQGAGTGRTRVEAALIDDALPALRRPDGLSAP